MALHVTQCPDCHTKFNTSAAHLAAYRGLVRCGACLKVFMGKEHFIEANHVPDEDSEESVFLSDNTDPANSAGFFTRGSTQLHDSSSDDASLNAHSFSLSAVDDSPDQSHASEFSVESFTDELSTDELFTEKLFTEKKVSPDPAKLNQTSLSQEDADKSYINSANSEASSPQETEESLVKKLSFSAIPSHNLDTLSARDINVEQKTDSPAVYDTASTEQNNQPPGQTSGAANKEINEDSARASFSALDLETDCENLSTDSQSLATMQQSSSVLNPDRHSPNDLSLPSHKETLSPEHLLVAKALQQSDTNTDIDPIAEQAVSLDSNQQVEATTPQQTSNESIESGFDSDLIRHNFKQSLLEDEDSDGPLSNDNLHALELAELPIELEQAKAIPNRKILQRSCLAIFLSLVLVLFIGWLKAEQFSQNPSLRPWYQAACKLLPCELKAQSNFSSIVSRSLKVSIHPELEDTLLISLVFENTASFEQDFPTLVFQFTDRQNQLIVEHRLQASNYLPSSLSHTRAMPVATPIRLNLTLDDPGKVAVNYNLQFIQSSP